MTTAYLTLDDALAAAEAFLGANVEVRDYGLLSSALGRPQASVFGRDAYADIHLKAAALLCSLVANHPLVDGNKRLGWVCVRLFYIQNNLDLTAPVDEAYDLVMSVAEGAEPELAGVAAALARWSHPLRS